VKIHVGGACDCEYARGGVCQEPSWRRGWEFLGRSPAIEVLRSLWRGKKNWLVARGRVMGWRHSNPADDPVRDISTIESCKL
jgi:hypothetical protein